MTHFYAILEGPSHAVAVGPLPDYDRAGTWVFPHRTGLTTGLIRPLFSLQQWLDTYGKDSQ